MRRLRDYIGKEMTWAQRHTLLVPEFEMRCGDELVATLCFRSVVGSQAQGNSADGTWIFKRKGFLRSRSTVQDINGHDDIAVFKSNFWSNGGTIDCESGDSYRVSTNFWKSKYDIDRTNGKSIICYEKQSGILKPKRVVTLSRAAEDVAEIGWLALFGWYLLVVQNREAASAAAAGASG